MRLRPNQVIEVKKLEDAEKVAGMTESEYQQYLNTTPDHRRLYWIAFWLILAIFCVLLQI